MRNHYKLLMYDIPNHGVLTLEYSTLQEVREAIRLWCSNDYKIYSINVTEITEEFTYA